MRRWFAISGVCHTGTLLALIFWLPANTSPPREVSAVFECAESLDRPSEKYVAEPEQPRDPAEDVRHDPWCAEVTESRDVIEPWEDGDIEAIRLPERSDLDPRQLCVRIKRRPVATPPTIPNKAAPPVPAVRVVRGATRAPTVFGQPSTITYPRRARRRALEGTVELKILVTREGLVSRIKIAKSSGHKILDEAAKSAVARWRFSPALRNGVPVAAWTRRVVHFQLSP